MKHNHVIVLGAGSWGTALALALHRAGRKVYLLPRFKEERLDLITYRENRTWLPNIFLPEDIEIGPCYTERQPIIPLFKNALASFWVIPTRHTVETAERLKGVIPSTCPIVIGTKGLLTTKNGTEPLLISQALQREFDSPLFFLSGPNLAKEVAENLYAASILASPHFEQARELALHVQSSKFHVSASDDIIGVQISGALKNVMAILCGLVISLGFGQNARAMIVTLGIEEIKKICQKLKSTTEAFSSLSGIGDIVLTCFCEKSRNTAFGFRIGQGEAIKDILENGKYTVEGYITAQAVYVLAHHFHLKLPLFMAIYKILYEKADPRLSLEGVFATAFAEQDVVLALRSQFDAPITYKKRSMS
ncbi:glycerol-3-phosphate dehydrogenase [NAD(P)+] [Alphaproteobacteria bacterium]|nr:glycerol-3-phosphate dehydrogenase [NAD(P)+] [Alphaproteobacteria bacterium]GHS95924.1 glycerol-3-phosphate dehydrogenase [NAD(P)+] [Alphaproteobacteria bacterium]